MDNLKELMTNGRFGKTNEGDKFVVVNDLVVYQDGQFDYVDSFLKGSYECTISKLVDDCKCFNSIDACHVIYTDEKKDSFTKEDVEKAREDAKKALLDAGVTEKTAEEVLDTVAGLAAVAALLDKFKF